MSRCKNTTPDCIPKYTQVYHCIPSYTLIAYCCIPSYTIAYYRIRSYISISIYKHINIYKYSNISIFKYKHISICSCDPHRWKMTPTVENDPHRWKMTPTVEIILLTLPTELCTVILSYPRSGNKEKHNGKYLSGT